MSDGTQETKLLECPFCGGEARLYDYDTATDTWIVICGSCPAVMASRKSPEEAADRWNRRATPSPVGASVKLICDKCNDYLEHPAYCETCYDTAVNAWREAEAALEKRGASVPSEVVEVLKLVYRKHHMGDPSIGWDELSDAVLNSLSNAMGVEELVKWQEAREDASNG